jgi:hypothetical protein
LGKAGQADAQDQGSSEGNAFHGKKVAEHGRYIWRRLVFRGA